VSHDRHHRALGNEPSFDELGQKFMQRVLDLVVGIGEGE
jgi:hypothetical protein